MHPCPLPVLVRQPRLVYTTNRRGNTAADNVGRNRAAPAVLFSLVLRSSSLARRLLSLVRRLLSLLLLLLQPLLLPLLVLVVVVVVVVVVVAVVGGGGGPRPRSAPAGGCRRDGPRVSSCGGSVPLATTAVWSRRWFASSSPPPSPSPSSSPPPSSPSCTRSCSCCSGCCARPVVAAARPCASIECWAVGGGGRGESHGARDRQHGHLIMAGTYLSCHAIVGAPVGPGRRSRTPRDAVFAADRALGGAAREPNSARMLISARPSKFVHGWRRRRFRAATQHLVGQRRPTGPAPARTGHVLASLSSRAFRPGRCRGHLGLVWALPDPSGRGEQEHQSVVVIRGAQALTVGVRLAAS